MTLIEAEHQVEIDELLEGLSRPQKEIPCKYFYDERGSILFEKICGLDEYYPTRTEISIMEKNIDEMEHVFDDGSILIEYGSGSSVKTRLLLNHLNSLSAYVPIDISIDHLESTAKVLKEEYPNLRIIPVAADYTKDFELPDFPFSHSKKVVYFPGSTIGNFVPAQARMFLGDIAKVVGKGGGLLIGVDLRKPASVLEPAYNDKLGITAEFNKNVLVRLNEEFAADFDINAFSHKAVFNEEHSRIEMYLVSDRQQEVHINGSSVLFSRDERILTEYSYKYTLERFEQTVEGLFTVEQVWTDEKNYFSVQYLQAV